MSTRVSSLPGWGGGKRRSVMGCFTFRIPTAGKQSFSSCSNGRRIQDVETKSVRNMSSFYLRTTILLRKTSDRTVLLLVSNLHSSSWFVGRIVCEKHVGTQRNPARTSSRGTEKRDLELEIREERLRMRNMMARYLPGTDSLLSCFTPTLGGGDQYLGKSMRIMCHATLSQTAKNGSRNRLQEQD